MPLGYRHRFDALFGSFLLQSPVGYQDVWRFTERSVVAEKGSFSSPH